MEAISLNLIPDGKPPILHASQYDVGRQFRINLFDGFTPYTLTGAETIQLSVRKPDDTVVTALVTNTQDNYVTFATTKQMTAVGGTSVCELSIEDSGVIIGTMNFDLFVECDPIDGLDPDSQSVIRDLQAQVDNALASSTFVAELEDIREGANGTEYAQAGEAVRDQYNKLAECNTINLLNRGQDKTASGITWEWNEDGAVTVDGENTSEVTAVNYLIGSHGNPVLPDKLVPGQSYNVKYHSYRVMLRFSPYNGDTALDTQDFFDDGVFTFPSEATGLIAVLRVAPGRTVDNETVKPILFSGLTNDELETAVLDRIAMGVPSNVLANGDDLNNFTTTGQWRVPTTPIGRSLLNKPREFNTTGILTIVNTHNTNHLYQILATNGFTGVWIRHIMISQSRFDEWRSITQTTSSQFSWQSDGFMLHVPQEEQDDMIAALAEVNVTITATTAWAESSNGVRNINTDTVYSLWDNLQAKYPQYIDAGETIGYSLDPEGNNYRPVKAYYIHPRLTFTRGGTTHDIEYEDLATIYITAGTHGGEGSPVWNLFATFRRAFMTGTIYSEFLKGRRFRVVPCFSCWGYDHMKRYLAAAYNPDGTQKVPDEDLEQYDANRMCICSDDTHPSYDTLTLYPYATEAKALLDYMETNDFADNPKDCYIDLHNCSYSLGYFGSMEASIRSLFDVCIDKLAKDWLANATWKNGDPVNYYETSTTDHFALNGKICAHVNTEHTFAWFFGSAYEPLASCLLEVQQSDTASCNNYAIAKGMDVTYRWLKDMLKLTE